MGIKHDTEDSLKDFELTNIDGQPTDEDLNQLTKECINAAALLPLMEEDATDTLE
jgi:hypothetical protein